MAICHVLGSCPSLNLLWHEEVETLQIAFLSLWPLLFQWVRVCVLACEGLCNLIRCLTVYSVNKPSVLLLLQTAAELSAPRVVGDGECSEFNKCPLAQLLFLPHKGRLQCGGKSSLLPAAMPWVAGGLEGDLVLDSRTGRRNFFPIRSCQNNSYQLFYGKNCGAVALSKYRSWEKEIFY